MDVTQFIGELLSMMKRRAFLWAAILVLGVLASLFHAASQPKVYSTSAVIQIEQPNIEDPTEARSRSLNAATVQKLQIIEQRVMARDNMLDIIRKLDLFADLPEMSDSDKVLAFRLASRVTQITDPTMPWRQDLSPTALNITVEFDDPALAAAIANELVENVLAENASRQAERARETLEFFESEETRVGNAISDLEDRIALYKQANKEFLPESLEEKRTQLTELRQILLELENQIVVQRENLRSGQDSIRGKRIQRLEEQRAFYQAEAASLAAAIDRAPQIEKDLGMLHRQMQKLSDQYRAITSGKAEAEMGRMLEVSHKGESFRVLERALPPEIPIRPNRKKTVALGAMLSAGIASAIVLMVELRNPVIWSASQLERQVQMRPVVTIPVVELPGQRRMRWMRQAMSFALLSGVFLALALLIMMQAR